MATPSNKNVKLGRGRLLFDRFDANGVRTGYRHFGNVDSFTIGIETETIEMKDYTEETSAPYDEAIISTDIPLGISGFEFDPFNLAIAFLGEESVFTQAASAPVAEVLAPATYTGLKGKLLRTAKRNISAVTLDQGATELVLGTDYEIYDAAAGFIRLLPTSPTVVDGTAITIDYTAAAIAAADLVTLIKGAVNAKILGAMYFLPKNARGPRQEAEIWKASLRPNGEIGFISDEYAKWQLEGKALSDAAGEYGGTSDNPFFQLYSRPAA